MADEPSGRHEISFEQLFPWLRLFRGIGVAVDAKKLMLAMLAMFVFQLGRGVLDPLSHSSGDVRATIAPLFPEPTTSASRGGGVLADFSSAPWRMTEPVLSLVRPFLGVFALGNDGKSFVHSLLAAFWGVLVWGFFGGAIARIAVVQVARADRVGMGEALRFARQKWLPLVGTPLSPMLGIAFFTALCAGFGLLYRLPGSFGPTLAGTFAVFPLLAGLVMTIVLFSLALGWPLMTATIAAEGEDGFDALSRSFAYVNQRPLRYAAYVALAWALGSLGLIVVDLFARTTIHMAEWALSFGAPDDILAALYQGQGGRALVPVSDLARRVHGFWLSLVGFVVHAWIYSYFWTAATIIYLILRQDVDGTPWHKVEVPEPRSFEFSVPEATGAPSPSGVAGTPDVAEPVTPAAADAPAHSS